MSTIRAENTELLERVEVSDKRAVDGVALVKATFQERIRVLEQDVAQTRAGYRLLLERERRTGDEIRRRAGEEPELRARCERLQRMIEQLKFEKKALQMDLDELRGEQENWLNEVEVGNQLSVEDADMDQDAEDEEDVEVNMEDRPDIDVYETQDDGYEMVHRCQWRTDGSELCAGFFADVDVR